MEAALVGLVGTTLGGVTGFAGAWVAQRGQVRIQQEQRVHAEQVRWLDDKKGLYRDLLIKLYGWRDSLASILVNADDGKLADNRSIAYKWIVETSLIADDEVRSAVSDVHRALLHAQTVISDGTSAAGDRPLQAVEDGLVVLEDALRAELSVSARVRSRSWARWRWGGGS
ncbi:hypothetical protein [Streptomyces paludis]|uniref:Uncharacterized protein n=1 Tax=Streptomyces paludis TaxID=2282738 RepID=A0A345HQL7_9ACTN|nr:hypothetical protein [Streptomyces paludis]AXG78991.1 hypothetical protein DVK44_16270 [Streptomyces paludis]